MGSTVQDRSRSSSSDNSSSCTLLGSGTSDESGASNERRLTGRARTHGVATQVNPAVPDVRTEEAWQPFTPPGSPLPSRLLEAPIVVTDSDADNDDVLILAMRPARPASTLQLPDTTREGVVVVEDDGSDSGQCASGVPPLRRAMLEALGADISGRPSWQWLNGSRSHHPSAT